MEWGMSVDLPLVWGELRCPNFVQVLDIIIFKGTDHCSKLFFLTNKKLKKKSEV